MIWSRRGFLCGALAAGTGPSLGRFGVGCPNAGPQPGARSASRQGKSGFDGIRAVHFAEVDPGGGFVKDPEAALDVESGTPLDSERILTPNVVHRRPGGYRMYYTGLGPGRRDREALGYILSARSEDARTWTREPGVRVDVRPPDATRRTLCPEVIPLPDGRYRMYYEARTMVRPTTVLSALSEDGLRWRPEPGIRLSDPGWSYGTPHCVYLTAREAGRSGSGHFFRLYCHRYSHPFEPGLGSRNHILSFISSDGLRFEEEPGVRIAQERDGVEDYAVYAPEVIRLGDGTFRMYYAAWGGEPMHGRIFTAASPDGLRWTKQERPCIDVGGPRDQRHASEPCIIDLPGGRARLFYEACDDAGRWRILSATSVARRPA